jgi:hypothetical protein
VTTPQPNKEACGGHSHENDKSSREEADESMVDREDVTNEGNLGHDNTDECKWNALVELVHKELLEFLSLLYENIEVDSDLSITVAMDNMACKVNVRELVCL